MIEDTETYYRRRCKEELEAAERSTDPIAAEVHRALAKRYSVLSGKQVRPVPKDQAVHRQGGADVRTVS